MAGIQGLVAPRPEDKLSLARSLALSGERPKPQSTSYGVCFERINPSSSLQQERPNRKTMLQNSKKMLRTSKMPHTLSDSLFPSVHPSLPLPLPLPLPLSRARALPINFSLALSLSLSRAISLSLLSLSLSLSQCQRVYGILSKNKQVPKH